jgi:hypothetical protein
LPPIDEPRELMILCVDSVPYLYGSRKLGKNRKGRLGRLTQILQQNKDELEFFRVNWAMV